MLENIPLEEYMQKYFHYETTLKSKIYFEI